MQLHVVSDLHVRDPEDPMYRSLLAILRGSKPGDIVVLAGDVFDFLIGHKQIFLNRYRGFFDAVASASRREVKVHYIEGNHDFLIRRSFKGLSGVEVHSREVRVEAGGKRFFFAHGDLVDRMDFGYLALRLFFRSPVTRFLAWALPGVVVDGIGKVCSRVSQWLKPRTPTQLSSDRILQLRTLYRSYAAEQLARGFDYVVMGHCHDLDEKFFTIGGRSGQYVNMGYPRVHGSYLSWEPGDERIQRERLPQ